jgi:hypothetical protein
MKFQVAEPVGIVPRLDVKREARCVGCLLTGLADKSSADAPPCWVAPDQRA